MNREMTNLSAKPSYRVMIVEDDEKIAQLLQSYLEKYDFNVERADHYQNIRDEYTRLKPDLILLDINLPYYDGFYWCRMIRTLSTVPIVFISARSGGMDQVMAIENGGDDYITKPFELEVVMAKIKGLLRRVYGEFAQETKDRLTRSIISYGKLALDVTTNGLEWNGQKTELTRNEFRLLYALMSAEGGIVSRDTLLEALWDDANFIDDNTLTVNVTRVRRKLAELGATEVVHTIRGQGYRLVSE